MMENDGRILNEERTLDLLLQLKNDFKPKGLCRATEELIELAKHDDCIKIMEGYYAHRLIIDMMKNLRSHGENQKVGCLALSKMMAKSENLKNLILQSQAYRYVMQALEDHMEDAAVLAATMETIASLASAANHCQFMLEKEVVTSVVSTMRTFETDTNIQINACKALAQLLKNDANRQFEMVCSNDYKIITQAIKMHSNSPQLLEYGFAVLRLLCSTIDGCDVLLHDDIHVSVMDAIKLYPKSTGVNSEGCGLLDALAYDDDSRRLLEVRGCSPLILKSLRTHRDCAKLQARAMSALAKLSDATFQSRANMFQTDYEDDWLEDVYKAMSLYPGESAVQEAACRALAKLMKYRPQNIERIGEDQNMIDIHTKLLTSLMVHIDDCHVFQSACSAIYTITAENALPGTNIPKGPQKSRAPPRGSSVPTRICKKLQSVMMEKGGYIPVLTGLQKHLSIPGAQAIGCKAIRGLTLFSPDYKETLVSCGALSDIIAAFSSHPDDVEVSTEAIGAIACLADVEVVRHQCITEAIHESIVDQMNAHQSCEALQEMALEALAVLSTTEEVYGLLKETQSLCSTVNAMQRFSDSAAIQKKGCVLLQVLVSPMQLSDLDFCETLADLIISAMKNFPMVFGVQAEGCVAMQILSEMSDQMSEVFVAKDGHERLFCLLDNHSENTGLVDLVCECLFVLGCIKDLKSQMLLSACKKGLLTGVECLVQLGADVNVGEGVDTPLCYACKREEIDMVKLLLRQGVTDMQTALKMSLEQKSQCIVGLLLKHMGHDREAGIVSWSGLGLGPLQPEWFYPTLLGRAYTNSQSLFVVGRDLAQKIRKSEEKRLHRQRTLSGSTSSAGKESPEIKLNIRYPWYSSQQNLHRLGLEFPLPKISGQPDSTDEESPFSEMEEPYVSTPRRLSMRTRHSSLDLLSRPLTSIDGRRMSEYADAATLCIEEEDWQKFSKTSANLPVSPFDPRSPWYSSSASTCSSLSGSSGAWYPQIVTRGEADGQSTSPTDSPRNSPVPFSQSDKEGKAVRSLSLEPIYLTQRPSTDVEDSNNVSGWKGVARKYQLQESPRRSATMGSIATEGSQQLSVKHFDLSSNHIMSLEHIALADRMLLSKFKSIEKLELSNNTLEQFPIELAKALPSLQQLHLQMNKFEVFPSHLLTVGQLKVLDLSNNRIKTATQKPCVTSFSLRELNISHNELAVVPEWIAECVPRLEILSLSGNKFEVLPDSSLSLRRLKTLNLSHNHLKSVPDVFLSNLPALDTIILSNNQLETLPEEVASELGQLTTVKVSHNKLAENTREPFFVPKFLLQLPSLRSVDLSNNQLVGIPTPNQWKTQSLREILVSHNNIKRLNISDGIKQWMLLERFTLSHNKLQEVPKEFGQLTSLTSLDFSHNKSISTIPDELGKLHKLWELPLDGLKLDLDPALLKGRTKDIIGFLNEKLKRAVPHYRIKLMLVGFGGRGKSTLLRSLQRIKSTPEDNIATVGVKVSEWRVLVKKHNKKVQYCLSTWDFAGQEDFYSTHPIFLSQRSLYLVVYDVSRGPEEVKTLKPWLLTIHARSPQSPVIVVGTHKDKVPKETKEEFIRDMREQVSKLCASPGFPEIKGYIEVCGTHENTSVEALRRLIVDVIDGFKVKGQPIMGQMIPHSYVKLEELICDEARQLKAQSQAPIVMHRKLLKLVKDADLQLDEDELSHAIRFLHESGVVLHYDDPALQLKDLYFVDPEWLCRMMAKIVTVREINPFIDNKGVMKKSDLRVLFNGSDFPPKFIPQYTRLLQKFEIALPKSETELLIPCKMPAQKPRIQLPIHDQLGILRRQYDMPYIPIGFWSRMISRLKLFSQNMISEFGEYHCYSNHGDAKQEKLSNMFEVHSVPHVDYWKEGIYVSWSEQAFFVVEPLSSNPDTLEIITPCTKFGMRLLGQVVDHVDVLIEEWFPGLCEIDPMLGRIPVQRLVPCPLCEEAHEYTLERLVEQSDSDDVIKCPNLNRNIPLYNLAPDVVLGDLEDRFRLMYDQFDFTQSNDNLLGDGSYGSVFRATYKNQPVAVKVFSKIGDTHPHSMLRQEVTVLRKLRHLSLISMIGVGVRPRVLVMELAPLGTLSSIQNADRPLSRGLQHRIALQVAEGLMFLHQHRIIYRDLKPDNVLIFSLSLVVLVNAKISDYGISRFATPLGLTASEGTPGYRAPEVAKGGVFYDDKVDVYSFGILLYEVVTGGRKPFEELAFRNELDDAVMKGRTLPPIAVVASAQWPDVQDLIYHCLEQVPEERPTSEEVFNRLNSAELLCLRKDYPVFKGVSAETVAIRSYSEHGEEKLELWLGGGDSTTGIISWISLNNKHTQTAAQGMILKSEDQSGIESRITSLLCLGAGYVVVGTESGTIWVCDAWNHQCKHQLSRMPDSVLCLQHYKGHLGQEFLFAGLANGLVAVFSASSVKAGPCINEKLLTISEEEEPVRCMTTARGKLWLGCGGQVVSIKLDTLVVTPHPGMEYTARNGNLITNIAVTKHIWVSRRGSPLVELWDLNKPHRHSTVNCETILRSSDPSAKGAESKEDYSVKSLSVQSHNAVWIGTNGGHVILLEPSTTLKVISVIHRHTGPVRAIAVRETGGSHQGSLVVTVGTGFIGRPGSPIEKSDMEYTYALVWDSAFSRQVHKLKADCQRREDWLERNEHH